MTYDVFLSFRGEEIRKTFLSHLLYSLDRKGIRSVTSTATYHPNNRAAVDSLVSICIISKNFTSLDWWVEESAKIIACNRKAVPVFVGVDPLDVLRVLNLADDSVGINEPRRNTLEMVKNWLDGHMTDKSGFNSSDWEDDSQLVDKITCFVFDNVTQASISNRWCPRIDWLKDTVGPLSSPLQSQFPPPLRSQFSSPVQSQFPPPLRSQFSSPVQSQYSPPSRPRLRSIFSSPSRPQLPRHHIKPVHLTSLLSTNSILRSSIPSRNVIEQSSEETPRSPLLHSSNPEENVMKPFSDEPPRIGRFYKPVNEVLSMLRLGDSTNELLTIGIYGMEGVGKTSLAKHVYEEISPQFQFHFFITNFSQKGSSLQEIFASETLNASTNISGVEEMVGRKVLLVVDNLDGTKQLKGFAKEVSLFGPGSRIIVITQDRSLLVQCGVKHIYQVWCPGFDEAIQLFSQFAFKQTNPASGFESFSRRAVEVAGRIPLALKVLGSYLYGRNGNEWESTLRSLEKSHHNYATAEVLKYIGAETPTIVELDENEENRFPLYSFTPQ